MKTALVIPVYNRPEYVAQCFGSLQALTVKPDVLIIVDDASTHHLPVPDLTNYFYSITAIGNEKNMGVRTCLLKGISEAVKQDCDTIINLDSDMVVKPDFIARMLKLMRKFPDRIVSGINCTMLNLDSSVRNPVVLNFQTYYTKSSVGGACLAYSVDTYHKYIRPALEQEGNWDHAASTAVMADNKPIIVCKPSVAQHIGMHSSMGHNSEEPDRADDYKFLSLPNVTLFGIDAHDPAGIERASAISQRDIEFGAVKIITERLFSGREAYSKFIMKDLDSHFDTSHVLIIHADGYVLNWKAWRPEWLQYDYIGATWWYKDNMNVGNGGFSLRSKKLQHILATEEIEYLHPEDHHICRTYRKSLEENFGIKFAPEEVANHFSIEAYNTPDQDYRDQFGFHSVHVNFNNSDVPGFLQLQPKQPERGITITPQRIIKRAPSK